MNFKKFFYILLNFHYLLLFLLIKIKCTRVAEIKNEDFLNLN